jgi:hypothetical protein
MSWQLVQEVLDHCPDLPYRQFRVLVALAADAKAETRRCKPGIGKIALQANCPIRTAQHALDMLRRRGLVKMVARPAPGRRPVYEILPVVGPEHAQPHIARERAQPHIARERAQHRNERAQRSLAPEHAQYEVAPPTSRTTSDSYVSLSRAERELRDALAGLGATDRETDYIIAKIRDQPSVYNPVAYLRTAIGNGDGPGLIDRARRELAGGAEGARPCDRDGPGRHSSACRNGESALCGYDWCECACHRRPA